MKSELKRDIEGNSHDPFETTTWKDYEDHKRPQ
jgi:hypothetical protein